MPEPREEYDQLIGRLISGRYRVKRLLGRGGMGKVYQAKQIALGREVALKVLSASYFGEGDPEFHKRFFHEAAIMAKLKSPHTVTVFDYGYDQGIYYIAMELVSGRSLDRELKRGLMPLPRVIAIVEQVCRSLREAHSKGIVHRDLKPGNVILTLGDDGEEMVKLLDFGLAKRMSTLDESNPDLLPGSPKYMSPEIIRQQPVDGRADIYALGVMLYQMLTGVVPFDRENPLDILKAHLYQQPPSMAAVNPQAAVPTALEKLVLRCLAKDPALRYRNIHEVIGELRQVAQQLGLIDRSASGLVSLAPQAKSSIPNNTLPQQASSRPVSPGLRMAIDDEIPEAMRPASDWNLNWIFPVVTAAVLLVITGAYFAFGNSKETGPSSVEVQKSPAGSTPLANQKTATGSAIGNKDMVFTVDELDKREEKKSEPTVRLEVTSNPAGATVVIGKRIMGQTPLSFEITGAQAQVGKMLEIRLEKPGYQPQVIEQTIDRKIVAVNLKLASNPVKPVGEATTDKKRSRTVRPPEKEEVEFEEALQHLEGHDWTAPISSEPRPSMTTPVLEPNPSDERSEKQPLKETTPYGSDIEDEASP